MKMSDLKNGMIVETAENKRYLVIDGLLIGKDSWLRLSSYNNDTLKMEKYPFPKFDIQTVYANLPWMHMIEYVAFPDEWELEEKDLLWERGETREVTIKEIEEKFGCKIKIVDEK